VTKEWNGLIKELLDEKADMVVTNFIIDEMRLGIIDFSTPFLRSGVTIMVSIRKGAISPYAFLGMLTRQFPNFLTIVCHTL
jgi:ABC-type amino acid transport substrate-binding protein